MPVFVMLSHESRRSSRSRSSASVLAAGAKVDVVIMSEYTGLHPGAEVRRRGYDALEESKGAGIVFLEDDIECRPDLFTRHVAMAVEADTITAFCAVNKRHYPPGTLDQKALPVSLAPIPAYDADRGFHGSMAVYIPQKVVEYGLLHPGEFMEPNGGRLEHLVIEPDRLRGKVTGFDFWLKHIAPLFGGMLVALPNSVNHASRHGTWPSLTYHVPEADPDFAYLEAIC